MNNNKNNLYLQNCAKNKKKLGIPDEDGAVAKKHDVQNTASSCGNCTFRALSLRILLHQLLHTLCCKGNVTGINTFTYGFLHSTSDLFTKLRYSIL